MRLPGPLATRTVAVASAGGRRLAGALTVLSVVALAALARPAVADGTELSLGTPPEATVGRPGATVESWVAVGHSGDRPSSVWLRQVALAGRDDGRLDVVEPGPPWAGALEVPARVDLGPSEVRRVPVRVRVPASAAPSLYLLGVVAQPAPAAGRGALAGRIVAYLTLEVPGARRPELAVVRHEVPRFAVGSELRGRFRLANRGRVSTAFRGQVRLEAPGDRVLAVVPAGDRQLVSLVGTARTVSYEWRPGGFLAVVRPELEVAFPTGTGRMGTVTSRGPLVVVVHPGAVLVLGLAVTLGAVRRLSAVAAPRARPAGRRALRRRGPPGSSGGEATPPGRAQAPAAPTRAASRRVEAVTRLRPSRLEA